MNKAWKKFLISCAISIVLLFLWGFGLYLLWQINPKITLGVFLVTISYRIADEIERSRNAR